ncbi:MAG: xanthine dehydrogenase family protein molybdopterin-binding subunit [Anaerolineales bacterium]
MTIGITPTDSETKVVGKSVQRIDAQAKVTGSAYYPGDFSATNQLWMKILFAERPHARILSIDTSKAEALEGVVAVFTAKDVPVNEYGLQVPDQPVLCGPGSDKPGANVVRFVGDQIALVVAESEEIAQKACELIKVDFEDLPILTDPRLAMQPDAVLIHPERGDSNICVHYKIRKGDVDAAFTQADVIVESEYQLPFQEHAYLQPESGFAYMDEEGRVTIEVAGQWAHTDRHQIAHALGLPDDQVRVIYPAIGGAFGGREDMSVQIVLALAAWRLSQRGINRPVKIIWSRRESIIGHCKRHPMYIKAKWGASKEGKLVAAEMELIADGGAYMYTSNKVLGNATIVCTGPYAIPNVKVDTYGVYTNNLPTGAFRGFGAPQGNFVAEMQMSKLAEALNMDVVELRARNALREGDTLGVGTTPPGGVSIHQVIEVAAERAGWQKTERGWVAPQKSKPEQPHLRRGIGFAAGFKNVGFSFGYQENCWARIELFGKAEIEQAILYHAGAEVGQGAHTVMVQMAAEALGIEPNKVILIASDTAKTGDSGSVSASRMTFMAGNAIRKAAQSALEKWRLEERPAIGEEKYLAPKTTPFDKETGYSLPNFAYAYAAQAVEVEVDIETGAVHLVKVVSADDVGKAINPNLVEGQIEGAIAQAQGYALLENFVMKDGRVLTDQLSTYLIPTVLDIPEEVEPVIVEVPDDRGPWGARGVGEPPFLPLAPAILTAIHDATGIWLNEIPVTPEKMWRAISVASK